MHILKNIRLYKSEIEMDKALAVAYFLMYYLRYIRIVDSDIDRLCSISVFVGRAHVVYIFY